LGWSRDDRDSALAPNSGRYQRFNSELGMIGDARYTRNNYQYQQYVPITKKFTFAFNGEIGLGKGLGGRPFPVFKNFYGGGLGSVRGFDQGTLARTTSRAPSSVAPRRWFSMLKSPHRFLVRATTAPFVCSASPMSVTFLVKMKNHLQPAPHLGGRGSELGIPHGASAFCHCQPGTQVPWR